MSITAALCSAGLVAFGLLAQAQAPPASPDLRGTIREVIQQARSLRQTQEAISAAVATPKAPRATLDRQIALTEKTLASIRASIEKIDEQYDQLSEAQQSAVREAWSIAKLFGVLSDFLKETAAKPDSAEREKDLISHATSTTTRAVMLDETLSRLNAGGQLADRGLIMC